MDGRLSNARQVPFLDLPGLSGATVPGHKGCLLLGDWADIPVLVFSGRLHGYEGHGWRSVVQPMHIASELGIRTLVLTNAAGGIRADLLPGTLMVLASHLDWTGPNGWRDQVAGAICPSPFDASLRERLQGAARSLGFELPAGVYAQVTGPCYETKAEIRALRACGADAVGMSTAREAQAAFDLGMRCAAISCITNRAAGLSAGPIHHDEVLDVAGRLRDRLARLFEEFLRTTPF